MKADPSVTMLYMLADPMTEEGRLSFYSLLEATMSLYDAPERTAVVFDSTGMPSRSAKANDKACADLKKRFPDRPIFKTLAEAEDWLGAKPASHPGRPTGPLRSIFSPPGFFFFLHSSELFLIFGDLSTGA